LPNTLSLRSSLNVSDQFSHPYTTTAKIIVLTLVHIEEFYDVSNIVANSFFRI
jgi:hypothetical protein